MKKINKIIKIFFYFKNPFDVINLYRGRFLKGEKFLVKPRKGENFFVARAGDIWLIEKVINGGQIICATNEATGEEYIVENGLFLRQGTSDTFVYKEVFLDECYKRSISRLNNESIVIDIGAHIGLFSLYSSEFCCQVYSYEPHPDNYKLAKKNIENRKVKNIYLNNLAVSSRSQETLYISDGKNENTGEHHLGAKGYPIETISLEDIFKKNDIKHCDLLKMDVEGAEYDIILNTPDYIFEKIFNLSMEYHPDLDNKRTLNDLLFLLKGNHFVCEVEKITEKVGLIFAKKYR
ncbi:MAG: FkbM family methyltransferase [Patescibacteria group bacterium]